MRTLMFLLPLLFTATGCGDTLKPKEVQKSHTQLSTGGTLDQTQALIISPNRLVASKTVPKALSGQPEDPAFSSFSGGLYVSLKNHCSPCHAGQNAVPFASPGVDLAFATAKKYVNDDPEKSQIVINIRARHNGVDPAWAAEIAPLVQDVAAQIP